MDEIAQGYAGDWLYGVLIGVLMALMALWCGVMLKRRHAVVPAGLLAFSIVPGVPAAFLVVNASRAIGPIVFAAWAAVVAVAGIAAAVTGFAAAQRSARTPPTE